MPGHTVVVSAIDAISADDAWLGGLVINRSDTAGQPLVEHWNGSGWHRVMVPRHPAAEFGAAAAVIVATSNRDFWAFSVDGHYLSLSNGAWSAGKLPSKSNASLTIGSAAAVSQHGVWAFGAAFPSRNSGKVSRTPYAVRFNGGDWHAVPVPGTGALDQATVISDRDILILEHPSIPAFGRARHTSVLRWNGTSWHPLPRQPHPPKGGTISTILASPATGIWLGGSAPNKKKGTSELALHWTGHAWINNSPHPAPSAQDFILADLAPDGSGGLWATSASLYGSSRFLHYSHGAWSAPIRSPWLLLGLAPVPHTKSIWAISENRNFTSGLIILHGQLPQ